MYKDIIHYELAEGVSETQLLKVAQSIIDSWMTAQKGFIRWEIHKQTEQRAYTDIVYWESEADAKQAEQAMADIPNAGDWYACYKAGSINSQNLHQIGQFGTWAKP